MPQQEKPPTPEEGREKPGKARSRMDAYLKYSGMAFQMGIIILIGALVGKKLDAYFQTERPYLTALMALLSILAALYVTLKDLFTGNNRP